MIKELVYHMKLVTQTEPVARQYKCRLRSFCGWNAVLKLENDRFLSTVANCQSTGTLTDDNGGYETRDLSMPVVVSIRHPSIRSAASQRRCSGYQQLHLPAEM